MTAVTVREGVATETGEVVALPAKFEMKDYLQQIRNSGALALQQALAAAYDEACRALIGPNDVQHEGKRVFKKKSAWRKLSRHFGISVRVARTEHEVLANGRFLATVIAQAIGPWGQVSEDVGACCTDEATGRRVITIADAMATAATRATNRAISNLIAMGEVSAEEIGDRKAAAVEEIDELPDPEPTSDTPWPGSGPVNGKKLSDWTQPQLLWLCEPGRKGPHIESWQQLARDEIKRRSRTTEGAAQ